MKRKTVKRLRHKRLNQNFQWELRDINYNCMIFVVHVTFVCVINPNFYIYDC